MRNWLDMDRRSGQWDPDLMEEKSADYHNVFMTTPEGLRVLTDLKRRAYEPNSIRPEDAIASLRLIGFVNEILSWCGVDVSSLEHTDAEASIARILNKENDDAGTD